MDVFTGVMIGGLCRIVDGGVCFLDVVGKSFVNGAGLVLVRLLSRRVVLECLWNDSDVDDGVGDVQGPQAGLPTPLAGLPSPLALSSENLDPRGVYLLFDGLRFVLWLGKVVPAEFVKDLLGPEAAYSADSMRVTGFPVRMKFVEFLW